MWRSLWQARAVRMVAVGARMPTRAMHVSMTRFDAPRAEPMPSAQKVEKTMQRFWKDVQIAFEEPADDDEHFVVQLDKRSLRTPGGNKLTVPSDRPLLACLIAQEWDEQTQVVKPHSLPLTSLVSRAIDGLSEDRTRKDVEEFLMRYFDTDAVCFHQDQPAALVKLQKERWVPLIDWARRYLQIPINIAQGTLTHKQPDEAKAKLTRLLAGLPPLDLAALERAVMTSKSMIIGLALVHRHIEAEQAALAAEVETAAQASTWGAIDDSHDVDHAELRRQLASCACAQVSTESGLVEKFVTVLRQRGGAFRT
ncbi:unnamed protein product [Malassezia sympodialis ATCC 42132]|uniref:Similar to S.cerevisiae protein ATP12 (Assembly factor for the F1 sector of mitochondrial F1F0 ATP synthase) n=1 Tax=Malassezia sympodialis (strain ATCC 42132) TaxID=1230383 RepID=M5EA09_MALS4|nr:uncharacterized protein MSY001_1736 [Malassezia sympodialis ATCC 42132]CCU99030.1 unnamed protein product [Malassezia sympodialis ATCC 42132]SHO79643.1 Similar to S.cerevisiae protein ATP12 (Assembly factor for the F1 sector of mitochondrial F1F0 ATP synthase) [Malassezia sympodialis ATCC 42132]|eukprot:XP_018740298.1 uncharacterized protein MSY001_1736 [Malassezia sympodialis ATCC 42132]